MLSKFLIHLDKSVREKASAILTQLMESRPEVRAPMVYGVGRFALGIPDVKSPIIALVLSKVNSLIPQ